MLLGHRHYFIKEHVAAFKLTDAYDILDPETSQQLGVAWDEPPRWAKYARLLFKKAFLPTTIHIYEWEGSTPVLSLHKKPGLIRSTVVVTNAAHTELGHFKSKMFSLGGGFFAYDATGQQFAEVKGDWKGWNFKLLDNAGQELGIITKKWAGIGKELFTTADNYIISFSGEDSARSERSALLLAAGLAIDIVFKER